MWSRIRSGEAPPLGKITDLAQHVLADEEDSTRPSSFLTWRHWLEGQGEARLQPRRWVVFNYTHQQVQAALTGHAVALGRLPLVSAALAQGDLIEPFGAAGRMSSSYAYWLVPTSSGQARPEVAEFARWLLAQAEETRGCMSAQPAVVKSQV
jgi:LysR family glycine cleavage system transcriptional activator